MVAGMPAISGGETGGAAGETLRTLFLGWNGAADPNAGQEIELDWSGLWRSFARDMAEIGQGVVRWEQSMLENGNLASNLLEFAGTIQSVTADNKV